ncbi:MAG: tyrosine--tRNA ligase, partial [Oceanospirillum sp.]|nr:tyrosine--tRNA ligase [Oceanospirillum sp.]
LMLKRFYDAGHKVIALVGGATGAIGDPSFKATERSLYSMDTVDDFAAQLSAQINRLMQPHLNGQSLKLVNNKDWFWGMNIVEFFRDVGKHFSVNEMMRRESVKQRLDRPDVGISFTEFSYTLLQSYDFVQLNKQHGVTLQIGGNDQWGNIVSGIDLTRRLNQAKVDGLTLPLITKSDGTKFGKTETGTVWLDAAKTSPYSFYQFWLNTADADVYNMLAYYTFLTVDQIEAIRQEDEASGRKPEAQRILAEAITGFVHGEAGLSSAKRITEALFAGKGDQETAGIAQLSEAELQQLELDGLPCFTVNPTAPLAQVLVDAALAPSKSKAREQLKAGAIRLNGEQVSVDTAHNQPEEALSQHFALFDRYWLIQRGKKNFVLLKKAD